MSIKAKGFLSPDVASAIPNVRRRHEKWFAFAEKLNLLAQEIVMAALPRTGRGRDDEDYFRRQLAVSPLLARCVSGFQAIVILGERGMLLEARCITRWVLEATFIIAAIHQDERFFEQYVRDDLLQKKRLLAKFREVSKLTEIEPELIDQMEREWTGVTMEIEAQGLTKKAMTTAEIAKRGGMAGHYLSLYTLLSQTVHNVVRDLDRHYITTAAGELGDLRWAPGVEEVGDVLCSACDILFVSLGRAMGVFGLDDCPRKLRFDSLWEEWKAIRAAE